jgi:predicted permease
MPARWRRFRSLFGLEPRGDVDAELAFHLDMRIRELVDRGESPERARALAMRRFGDYESSRQACVAIDERQRQRVMRTQLVTELGQDIRYALRMLRRTPGFTAVAVLTLALGIGANTAIFSVFNQVLQQSLPVPDPQRLVNLAAPGPKPGSKRCGMAGDCTTVFSYPMFRDLERLQTVFTGIAAHRSFDANLAYGGETALGTGAFVSGQYFPVLGLQPALGRLLGPNDDRALGEPHVVVLSHGYWQSRFGGRRDILNDTLAINGQPLTIVGVAPHGFAGTTLGIEPQAYVPVTMRWLVSPDQFIPPDRRQAYWIYLFARLKPGVSVEQARTGINVVYGGLINDIEAPLHRGMSERTLAEFKAKQVTVTPERRGQSNVFHDIERPLTLLLGVTTLVLLIACVNIANLLLARAAARTSEMAMRLSIGAGRWRLIRQLLTESSILTLLGGIASLFVALWTVALVRSLVPESKVTLPLHLDETALIVTAALALGASAIVGLFPALQASRPDVLGALKGLAGQPAGGRRAARFRASLATVQIALSMVLILLAGLFTKSLANITRVDPGVALDGLVTFALSPQRNGDPADRSAALFARVEDELAALPGVTAVASGRAPLLANGVIGDSVLVEGFDVGPDTDNDAYYDEVGAGYFGVVGIPLVAGREFSERDAEGAPKVVIVNEEFARKFGLGRDAVGKRMSRSGATLDMEIVGLVRNARHADVKEAVAPMFFVPHRQGLGLRSMNFYVRASVAPEHAVAPIRELVKRLDPNLPVENLRTLREQMRDETLVLERFMSVLTAAFAGLAMLLAGVGLYGVLAYTVAQRTGEIGLRMALGATATRVRGMVLRHVALMVLVGGTLGLALGLAVARAAQALLFELQFDDAGVLAAAIAVLVLLALGSGLLPANRAARVDPMRALRYE